MDVRIRHLYRVNGPLSNLTGLVLVFVMAGSLYTSAKYNYQNAFRNLVNNVKRSSCLSMKMKNPQSISVDVFR